MDNKESIRNMSVIAQYVFPCRWRTVGFEGWVAWPEGMSVGLWVFLSLLGVPPGCW